MSTRQSAKQQLTKKAPVLLPFSAYSDGSLQRIYDKYKVKTRFLLWDLGTTNHWDVGKHDLSVDAQASKMDGDE